MQEMDEARVAQLQAIIEPILADKEMELVELVWRPQGHQQLIRLLVDKVGGVTIQQCAHVNTALGHALEAAGLIEGSYTIEVSSPGLDRPLSSKRDFERAIGDDLLVTMQTAEGRTTELRGMLLAVQHEAIVLKTTSGNVTVPSAGMRTATKALRW